MNYAEFTTQLKNWTSKAIDVRDESQELVKTAMSFLLKDWNTNGLTDMVNALHSVRGFDTSTFMKYVFFLTGGDTGMTEKGLPIVDPEKSYLLWDMKKNVFKVKPGASFDEVFIIDLMQKWSWFDFCPKSVPNPYEMKNLFTAIRKAMANKAIVEPEHAKLIETLAQTVADAGYAEHIEQ